VASDNPGARPKKRKSGPGDLDGVAEKIAGKIGERLSDTLERKSAGAARRLEHLERHTAKAARKAEAIERIAAHIGALDVWTRVEPAARRPRFTREAIAAVATRIADAEGFAAVSMRRIALELDAGTMTLYHYVRTKDELLTLITDAVMGEVVIPPDEAMPTHWRDALARLAERSRAALQRHPWILDIADDPPIGPNSVRHFDQSLQAVASLPISLGERVDIVGMVDEYVFGYCLQVRNNGQPEPGSDMIDYVNGLLATGDYPYLSEIAADVGLEAAWTDIEAHMRDESRFARNLDRLLDGIEASLP
jgi:AcrR family transcriptional regulator